MSKLEETRLFMVMNYLHSIEDPYQYGDNYGDLVEYLKMLIEGEEEYIPEEYGRIDERDFFEKHLKDSDYWKYPKFGEGSVGHAAKNQRGKRSPPSKFIEWVKENAVRPEVIDDGKIIVDTEEDKEFWGLDEIVDELTKKYDETLRRLGDE